ncbi:hypothetical protein [Gottfriedia luciferensis]|uniref:hypothetical protein n=1 Tax=Gottfriedia luciferensis TaxID=178774 RepID=UPI000B450617|nr:hypothetical protein [Gottfriedia luciferensis]
MKKIKLLLDYKCYPMWIYDENDELVDNDLVEELRSDIEIDEMLIEIQRIYDSLFIDDSKTFEYKGFVNCSERISYIENIEKVLVLIKRKLRDKYIITNDIDI